MMYILAHMKKISLAIAVACGVMGAQAQDYQVSVSEQQEKMLTGKYQPTWESLEKHQTPEWLGATMCGGVGRLDGPLDVYRGEP